MTAILDIWHSILAIATGGDYIALAIIIVAAFVAGWAMPGFGSIVTGTFAALVLLGLAVFARGALAAGGRNVGALARTDWDHLLRLPVHDLLTYAVALAILVALAKIVRSVVMR